MQRFVRRVFNVTADARYTVKVKKALRAFEHLAAIVIFILHCIVIAIGLFGWLWEAIWPIYVGLLTFIVVENIFLGYCILTRWEFALRKALNPHIRYSHNFTSYYTYKFTRQRISEEFLRVLGIFFCSASLCISLYFKFIFVA